MLFSVKLILLKANAAVVLQKELEYAKALCNASALQPASDANRMIEIFCENHSEFLRKTYNNGGLPHKLILATIATAFAGEGVFISKSSSDKFLLDAISLTLVRLLVAISDNGMQMKLNQFDYILIEKSSLISEQLSKLKGDIWVKFR